MEPVDRKDSHAAVTYARGKSSKKPKLLQELVKGSLETVAQALVLNYQTGLLQDASLAPAYALSLTKLIEGANSSLREAAATSQDLVNMSTPIFRPVKGTANLTPATIKGSWEHYRSLYSNGLAKTLRVVIKNQLQQASKLHGVKVER